MANSSDPTLGCLRFVGVHLAWGENGSTGLCALDDRGIVLGSGRARTDNEVDAYVCAYIGLYYRHWGDERCRVVGTPKDGYIVTPVNADAMSRWERIVP